MAEVGPFNPSFCQFAKENEQVLSERGGIVVHPPEWWTEELKRSRTTPPDCAPEDNIRPIKQHVFGRSGVYTAAFEERKPMSHAQFKALARAQEADAAASTQTSYANASAIDAAESSFWRGICASSPLYGSDSDVGSLFPRSLTQWNVGKLDGGPRNDLLQHAPVTIPGLNKSMLYFGAKKTFFALHTEDSELQGVSFLHHGAPKVWYVVPPRFAPRVRRLAADLFPHDAAACAHFLRHKTKIISPAVLRASGIPVTKLVQREGDFVLVQSGAFHFGFNLGYNIAEAVNFALTSWLPRGRAARPCVCNGQTPHVDPLLVFKRVKRDFAADTREWWCFSCACGEAEGVTNFDAEEEHPHGELFECSGCGAWGHIHCYPEYVLRQKSVQIKEPGDCDLSGEVGADCASFPEGMYCIQCRDAWRDKGEAWTFTCKCGKNEGARSDADGGCDDAPTGRMFECTVCQCWSHTECYSEYAGIDDDDLPDEMRCHKCVRPLPPSKRARGHGRPIHGGGRGDGRRIAATATATGHKHGGVSRAARGGEEGLAKAAHKRRANVGVRSPKADELRARKAQRQK